MKILLNGYTVTENMKLVRNKKGAKVGSHNTCSPPTTEWLKPQPSTPPHTQAQTAKSRGEPWCHSEGCL